MSELQDRAAFFPVLQLCVAPCAEGPCAFCSACGFPEDWAHCVQGMVDDQMTISWCSLTLALAPRNWLVLQPVALKDTLFLKNTERRSNATHHNSDAVMAFTMSWLQLTCDCFNSCSSSTLLHLTCCMPGVCRGRST